jgi:glycosyltransferase involved in cell wall biosynthesis
VGRLAPEKEVHSLPEILKSMSDEMRNQIDWLVVGDGPLREDLQKKAPSNMRFTGYLEGQSLAEVYSASDLFVFPSTSETFGNVVLEALASGTPVIGANAGGVKNIIKSGVTGDLCSPGNVEQFSRSIERILTNDGKRLHMRLEGRKYALMQKWDRIFACILWHYTSVIEEQNGQKHA